MKRVSAFFSGLVFLMITACHSEEKRPIVDTSNRVVPVKAQPKESAAEQSETPLTIPEPDYNYSLQLPAGWTSRDTTMNGLRIRLIKAPEPADSVQGNMLISYMGAFGLEEFTERNRSGLETNMPGITLLDQGSLQTGSGTARWFTYRKVSMGHTRDMINYIIPYKHFAYMLTGGSRHGTMKKYRSQFDAIAKSFKG